MQVQEGERDPSKPARPPGHTIIPPLPRVETAPDGTRDIPEDILPWQGSIFSVFSNAVADWTGSGYGALLETPSVRRLSHEFPVNVGVDCRFSDGDYVCSTLLENPAFSDAMFISVLKSLPYAAYLSAVRWL